MNKIGIVLLNYLNYQDTIECVESILKMHYDIAGIVIVDNHSENESYAVLHKIYQNAANIIVVKTGKNYGFAKGNNIGINIARKRFQTDFVFLANNDTLFMQEDYFEKLLNYYEDGVGVIGSEIRLDGGIVQKRYMVFTSLKEEIFLFLYYFSKLHDNAFLRILLPHIYRSDYAIHACAMLLTPDFFIHYEGLYKKTFLYCEEDILYLMCKMYHLKQRYTDDTYIFHKENQSSQMSFNDDEKVMSQYKLQSIKYVIWWMIKEKIHNRREHL